MINIIILGVTYVGLYTTNQTLARLWRKTAGSSLKQGTIQDIFGIELIDFFTITAAYFPS